MVAQALPEFSKQPALEVIKATAAAVDELKFRQELCNRAGFAPPAADRYRRNAVLTVAVLPEERAPP